MENIDMRDNSSMLPNATDYCLIANSDGYSKLVKENCYNCLHSKDPGYCDCINCYNIVTKKYERWTPDTLKYIGDN